MAVGIFCIGTLFGMIDLQLSRMDAAHRASEPSHINLILRADADNNLLTEIRELAEVDDVDTMAQLTVRFRLPGWAGWQMGSLIIRPDYLGQSPDQTTLQDGLWPIGESMAIERLSAQAAGLKTGDTVEFETVDGVRSYAIGGLVRHPFVKPPKFGGQWHFFASSQAAASFGVQAHSFRQLLIRIKAPYRIDKAREVASRIRLLLNRHQIGVNVTLLQNPEQHWGRPFFAGINRVLQVMALAALVLASVLIFNTLSAHVTQQTEQIGVMKALGGSTWTIAGLYLLETLLMALLAVALAAPSSLAAAHFSSCRLLDLFNIDCGSFTFSKRALLIMIVGGLAAPLLSAMFPIWRGAALTVRVALASYGLGSDFGCNRVDRCIDRFGNRFLPTLYAAALGNLFRRKARLLLTQLVLVAAGVTFMVLMSLAASVNLTLDNEMARSRHDVRLGFVGDQDGAKIRKVIETVLPTTKVEFWQRVPIEGFKEHKPLRQKGALGVQLLALPAASPMYRPLIERGRWLRPEDAGQRVLVMSAESAELSGIDEGDSVEVQLGSSRSEWQVVGLYRWLAGSGYTVEPVYAPLETVQGITGRRDQFSFALLKDAIATLSEESRYLDRLKQAFQDNGIKLDVYTTQGRLEQRQFTRNQFNPVIGTLLGLASMIAAVGGIGLSGTLAIGVLQRIREIGVLRSIGAPSRAIFRLFLMEGLLHGILAWLISVPLAFIAARALSAELGMIMFGLHLDYAFDLAAVGYWLFIVVVLSGIAAYWPAHKAAGITIRESLGNP